MWRHRNLLPVQHLELPYSLTFLGRLQKAVMTLEDMPLGYREILFATNPHSALLHGAWRRELPGDLPQPLGVGHVTFVEDAALPIRPVTGVCGWRTWS